MIRRHVAAILALLFWLSLAGIGHAQGTVSDAEATAAIKSWLDALSTGDPTRVDPLLAPEFQLIRGDRTYTKAEYLKAMAKLGPGYRIDALVVTSEAAVSSPATFLPLTSPSRGRSCRDGTSPNGVSPCRRPLARCRPRQQCTAAVALPNITPRHGSGGHP